MEKTATFSEPQLFFGRSMSDVVKKNGRIDEVFQCKVKGLKHETKFSLVMSYMSLLKSSTNCG